jgi:hypothetical protein
LILYIWRQKRVKKKAIKKADLLAAALVLRAIFVDSLGRQESLGSFKRSDFPEEMAVIRFCDGLAAVWVSKHRKPYGYRLTIFRDRGSGSF